MRATSLYMSDWRSAVLAVIGLVVERINCYCYCRLGGVVVSVLATGPKGRCSNPAEAMGFKGDKKSSAHLPSDGK
jgi:hypothetical protein